MATPNNIAIHADSLIELLGAQCCDLEKLLMLAREETLAAQQGKFLKVWEIVSERADIGRRLETFHRQIAELRGKLESVGENVSQFDITNRVVELANQTLVQDQITRSLLNESRARAAEGLNQLARSRQGTNAYMHEQTKGLALSSNY